MPEPRSGEYVPLNGREPFDRALRERSFGLVRADGSEKPAAEIMRGFARRLAAGEVPLGAAPAVLDVSADVYYTAPDTHFRCLTPNNGPTYWSVSVECEGNGLCFLGDGGVPECS